MSANQEIIAELRRVLNERDEAQARVIDAALIHADLVRERDEARAKIAGLPAWQKGCEQALGDLADAEEAIARLYTERDEAREEVQDYREQLRKLPDANRVASQDAFRRGAEAMREACAREASVCANHRGEELDAILSALPIPEEPC